MHKTIINAGIIHESILSLLSPSTRADYMFGNQKYENFNSNKSHYAFTELRIIIPLFLGRAKIYKNNVRERNGFKDN